MVSLRTIATAALALAAPIYAQSTPAQIVTDLNTLTQQAQNLQKVANTITTVNAPFGLVGQGPLPQVINGLVEQVTTISTYLQQSQDMTPVAAGADSDAISKAYTKFASAQSAFLNTLTSKADILSMLPLNQPITAALRSDESAVDSFSFQLIANVPSRANDIKAQYTPLSNLFTLTIQKYSGSPVNLRSLRFGRRAIAV